MSDTLLNTVTPAQLIDALQQAGCRATEVRQDDKVRIQSAAQGLGFIVGFGNRVPGSEVEEYSDFSFQLLLTVEGEASSELVAGWNRDRRFARLAQVANTLVLSMDVLVAGGVSPAWLRGQVELWDFVLREYVRYLQAPAARAA